MLALKVPLRDAESVKRELLQKNLIDKSFSSSKKDGFLFFPVVRRFRSRYPFASIDGENKKREKKTLKEALKGLLSKKDLDSVKTAFDTIGSIAILEIDEEMKPKARLIANALLATNKNIRTVLMKSSSHGGEFRTQDYEYLAGANTKIAEYRENNVVLRFDVEKVYFSVRLSNERKRIMQLVKPGEDVLVLFSGCAPYPCVIAKNTGAKEVWGVEKNPEGHKWGLENVRINKLKNVKLFCDDAGDFKARKKFDRILMPLPKSAADFLDDAFRLAKKKAVIHFYDFLEEGSFDVAKEKVKAACRRSRLKCRFLKTVKCGQHSPRLFRICLDFEVEKINNKK